MKTKAQLDAERVARAQALANSVKNGTFRDHQADTMESWFPIRPKIKKSKKDIEKLYGIQEPKLAPVPD